MITHAHVNRNAIGRQYCNLRGRIIFTSVVLKSPAGLFTCLTVCGRIIDTVGTINILVVTDPSPSLFEN